MTIKKKVGVPPKYETPEELQEKINEYFDIGVRVKTVICGPANNRYEVAIKVPTISGLCLYLGFASRQSFYDLEERDGFSYTIKKARLAIEQEYEEQLQTGTPTGAIFALKNFDWKDKTEVEHGGRIDGINIYNIINQIRGIIPQGNNTSLELDSRNGLDERRTRQIESNKEVSQQGVSS